MFASSSTSSATPFSRQGPVVVDSDPDVSEGSESESSSSDDAESDAPDADEAGAAAPLPREPEDSAESRIEGDFDQMLENIRGAEGAGAGNMLGHMWHFDLADHEEQFRDDLKDATGIGKRGKGKQRRGRKAGPTLSYEVKTLIGEGNQAYVDNNTADAARIMQEVIRIEPRAASAWTVLAQCYTDLGEHEKALQLRIMSAHLLHDAEEWDRLARQSRDMGFAQQALYCYGKVYALDPDHVDAMWDRATLAKELGDLKTARHALSTLLKRVPHDLTVLQEIRPVLVEGGELQFCAELFQAAFVHFQHTYPAGFMPVADGLPVPGGGFDALQILVLADLHNALGSPAAAIGVVRAGTRWLQGRGAQRFWDACEDDREFDLEGGHVAREGEPRPGAYQLDVNARHRLAIARIKNGDVDEGKMHTAVILAHNIMDYASLYLEIADAYFEKEMYAEARPVYEALGADASTSSVYILLQTAACRRAIGDHQEAAEVYEHVIAADPSNTDVKMKLAELYEILNQPRKALDLVYQVIDYRRRRSGRTHGDGTPEGEDPGSLFAEKARERERARAAGPKKLSAEELRALEAEKEKETLRGYARAQELWPRMVEDLAGEDQATAEREWFFEVERLIESFRETRRLFQTSRIPFRGLLPRSRQEQPEKEAADMASRLHLEMAYERSSFGQPATAPFRGIPVDDWLVLFMQYCFRLTQRGAYEQAEEVLSHLLFSSAFLDRESQDSIRLTLVACASSAGRYDVAVQHVRKLIYVHQFNNEPVRVLLASLAGSIRSSDSFINTAFQKHVYREIRIADAAAKNRDSLSWFPAKKRYGLVKGKGKAAAADEDEDEDEEAGSDEDVLGFVPAKFNPVPVTLYGQMCNVAKSYQSAIFYLLHAYDYCPQDPVICLTLGIAYLGRAMQRQSDNRHHLVAQSMAFFSQYRAIRGSEREDEVEYNFGRAFHQLGLFTLAMRHYERVLAIADGRPEDEWGMAREAAYNLSLIFVITGASPLAEDLYRKWLSI